MIKLKKRKRDEKEEKIENKPYDHGHQKYRMDYQFHYTPSSGVLMATLEDSNSDFLKIYKNH